MNKLFKKITSLPTGLFTSIIVGIITLIVLSATQVLEWKITIGIVGLILIAGVSYEFGYAGVSALMSMFIMLLAASNNAVITLAITQGYFVLPFMLSIAIYVAFLFFTYGSHYNYEIRSRWFWACIVSLTYNATLFVSLVLFNANFTFANVLSVAFTIGIGGAIFYWFNNSKKTKVNTPKHTTEIINGVKVISLEDSTLITTARKDNREYDLDVSSYKFINRKHQATQAYGSIYSEIVRAYDVDSMPVIYVAKGNYTAIPFAITRRGSKMTIPSLYIQSNDSLEIEELINEFTKQHLNEQK